LNGRSEVLSDPGGGWINRIIGPKQNVVITILNRFDERSVAWVKLTCCIGRSRATFYLPHLRANRKQGSAILREMRTPIDALVARLDSAGHRKLTEWEAEAASLCTDQCTC
jgi:hypothetical protein